MDDDIDGGDTALIAALHKGHIDNFDIVNALIMAGAAIDIENHYGLTALFLASGRGHTEIEAALRAAAAAATK